MSESNNHERMDPFKDSQARMQYAGSIQLLVECYLNLPNNKDLDELRESIIHSIDDWCEMTGWGYTKILNRIELIPPHEDFEHEI